ncbi:MAG TPA: Crp/Fnr family transcriptional regulator [Pararhizobium sp.]|nr:Crp/Fnr family transcriptional regulator [Pararhizobium sp.]
MSALLDALVLSLERRDRLSDGEKEALQRLNWQTASFSAASDIISDRSHPTRSCLLLSGMAARSMSLANGDRQLAILHIPGDFIDLHGLLLKVMDHAIIAMTDCRVAFVPHTELRQLIAAMPHVGRLIFTMLAIDAAIERNWILTLGRKRAESRLANLICELYLRYEVVGAAENFAFPFPVSQAAVADMLGLSAVHTNRVIGHLRSSGLVEWGRGTIRITDWRALSELGGFDPVYLNLTKGPR